MYVCMFVWTYVFQERGKPFFPQFFGKLGICRDGFKLFGG